MKAEHWLLLLVVIMAGLGIAGSGWRPQEREP